MASEAATITVAQTKLKAGALRLPSIFMQSLTMVAPGIAALFYTPVVVSQAGLAAPLAYPIAFIIVLFTAVVLAELAKAVPSAGGYYTYVAAARSAGPACSATGSRSRSAWSWSRSWP